MDLPLVSDHQRELEREEIAKMFQVLVNTMMKNNKLSVKMLLKSQ
jgi:hypothetical protein